MSVTTSAKYDLLADGLDSVFGEMAKFVLLRALTKYAVEDFVDTPWSNRINLAYARRKLELGATPTDDLVLTGTLLNEVVVKAPKRIAIEGTEAYTSIKLIYAASHQYGDLSRGIPQRKFIRLEEHREDLISDLDKEFETLLEAK